MNIPKDFVARFYLEEGIDDIHEINIISAEYYIDHYRYGTREEYYKVESEEKI